MGTMSESCYNNPYQEQCVGIMCDVKMSKMLHCAQEGCKVRVHNICQIDWLKQHFIERRIMMIQFFANSTTSITRIMFK
jgi:hypothetical protein